MWATVFWMLERRIERREKQQEAAEKAREEFETHLYESSIAAIALGEATARAVQRIPDAHRERRTHGRASVEGAGGSGGRAEAEQRTKRFFIK